MNYVVLSVIGAQVLMSGASALAEEVAAETCRNVSGKMLSVRPAKCAALTGVCTIGLLDGDFHAFYDFSSVTMNQVSPQRAQYTGVSTITVLGHERRVFSSVDEGEMTILDDGTAQFTTYIAIPSGVASQEGISGKMVATGRMNLQTGVAEGVYSGAICGI